MSIQLPDTVDAELRELAKRQGRDVCVLAEEAVRLYLAAVAITDVDSNDVAETQAAVLPELSEIPDWEAGDA
jgi:predicted transcriptional regulator